MNLTEINKMTGLEALVFAFMLSVFFFFLLFMYKGLKEIWEVVFSKHNIVVRFFLKFNDGWF